MGPRSGVQNEYSLCEAIDGETISSIKEPHLREFIKEIFDYTLKSSEPISCEIAKGQIIEIDGIPRNVNAKQDLVITAANKHRLISVKKGKNNSVHQEPITVFIDFLKDLGATTEIVESLLLFQWADGTLDNTGKNRLKYREVIDTYVKEMKDAHNFLNTHKEIIIERALSKGAYDNLDSQVDYIYHGTRESGVWCSLDYAIKINSKPENSGNAISIGFLKYQNQNRNTTLNPSKEKARAAIQFKWSNMEAILEKSMSLKSRLQVPKKILGSNKHGFDNINIVTDALNGQEIGRLKPNLKKFIMDLFPTAPKTAIITAEKINAQEKGSIDITIGSEIHRVLIKSGTGNSVHQELYEDFYEYLQTEFKADEDIINSFKLIQWGDGTLDGSGPKDKWMNAREIKRSYPEAVKKCKDYINQKHIATALLKRFIETGKHDQVRPNEYVYFGNMSNAYWAKNTDVIDYQFLEKSQTNRPLLNIGNFNFQSWGRTIKKSTGEDQRESLQIKVSRLEQMIIEISKNPSKNTYYEQGLDSEMNFVKNYNSRSEPFKITIQNNKFKVNKGTTSYAVQIDTKQQSRLTKNKENTKSDVYLIETLEGLNEQLLYENDFCLKESDIEELSYNSVVESGVSIKRADSKSYTYAKFSQNSFEELFNNQTELFIGALLYVRKESDINKNKKILNDTNFTLEELLSKLNIQEEKNELLTYRKIKDYSLEKIKNIINDDVEIYNDIFFGTSIFEDPYCATYLYRTELKHKNVIRDIPFSVTTGSGRSRGSYTIIIKP